MTKHRKHHPKSSIERLTLPRKEGGRGIIDIQNLHNKQISTLRHYFHTKSQHSLLHKQATEIDNKLTPLNLKNKNTQPNETLITVDQKVAKWAVKSLHGRHRTDLSENYVYKEK